MASPEMESSSPRSAVVCVPVSGSVNVSVKSTEPVGVPVAGDWAATAVINVSPSPYADGLPFSGSGSSVVTVGAST